MELSTLTTGQLATMLDEMNASPTLAPFAEMVATELDSRRAAEVKAEESAALRELADQAAQLLSDISASKVADVASTENAPYKRAARALVGLMEAAYDMTTLKARHAFDVLTDTEGQTDASGKTVALAVDYAKAHAKSTVYR